MAHNTSAGSKSGADSGIQSVARALSILELFDERRVTLSTTEIAELTTLNRGTAYRFCQTLKNLGYLEEVRRSVFRPGLKVVSLAQAALDGRELVDVAMPRLQQLRHDTGETVNMALLDGSEIVYVVRLLNDDLLALRLVVGSRLPAVSSSLGRAALAFLPEEQVNEILSSSAFRKLTSHTITDHSVLLEKLAAIRQTGYSFIDQEVAVGVRGVAAPVFGDGGLPIAAVNLSITRPLSDTDLANLVPLLTAATKDISDRMRTVERLGP